MNRVGILVIILVIFLLTESVATIANEANNQQKKSSPPTEKRESLPTANTLTGQPANAVIRGAIFGNRRQLLSYLGDQKWRRVICTPALKDTYDLFQASLKEELDILWDLDLNTSEQGPTKMEHDNLKACISEMEKYDDNLEAWEQLSKVQRQ